MTRPESVAEYHLQTTYHRNQMSGSGMDWSNQPNPHKQYVHADNLPMPRDLVLPRADIRDCLTGRFIPAEQPISLSRLAGLLFMAYGVTARTDHGADTYFYRAAPSAGALYPVEIYFACGENPEIPAGLYHCNLAEFVLTRLRSDLPPAEAAAPSLILTARYFRSAWKYGDRAFRYCLLDTGHVAENLMIAGSAMGLRPEFSAEFDDQTLVGYLGLDREREGVLATIRLKGDPGVERPSAVDLQAETVPRSEPVARDERIFPTIVQAAQLTGAPLTVAISSQHDSPEEMETYLPTPDWEGLEPETLVQTLQRRRSRRNFRPRSLTRNDLSRLLALAGVEEAVRFMDIGFISNEIKDIPDAFHRLKSPSRLTRHRGGFLGPQLAHAALGQDWVGRANAIFILSAPIERMEALYGPRYYRLFGLMSGRFGQRLYLAAEALGWGCCGVGAFFDLEVAELLNLPAGTLPLYIVPIGTVQKRTQGGRPGGR